MKQEAKIVVLGKGNTEIDIQYKSHVMELAARFDYHYKALHDQHTLLKKLVEFEAQANEEIFNKLQDIINEKDTAITNLTEAFKVPRIHFQTVNNLLAADIIKQKDEIIEQLAIKHGVPPSQVIGKLYSKQANSLAKKEIAKDAREFGSQTKQTARDTSVGKLMKATDSCPKLTREFSLGSVYSKSLVSSLEGSTVGPPFKHGRHSMYTAIANSTGSLSGNVSRQPSPNKAAILVSGYSEAD